MGSTFRVYLERCARFRERDGWVAWLADEAGRAGWTPAAADAERDAAWSQFTQGQPQEAVERMQALIQRLEQTTEFDPAFQLANARGDVGRMYLHGGAANRAIPILEQAVGQWERLAVERGRKRAEPLTPALSPEYRGEGVRGVPDPASLAGPTAVEDDPQADRTSVGNLSATLGDLANALMAAGRLDEALVTAERGGVIDARLGNDREAAVAMGQMGQLDRADEHAHRAREIDESLGLLGNLWKWYHCLAQIAQARRDDRAAAEWAAKEQAAREELARRARGGDDDQPGGLPQQVTQMLANLAVTCIQAAANRSPLPSDAAGLLDQLDSPDAGLLQPPAAYLRRLATARPDQLAGHLAHPPAELPEPLSQIFAQLRAAVQDAGLD